MDFAGGDASKMCNVIAMSDPPAGGARRSNLPETKFYSIANVSVINCSRCWSFSPTISFTKPYSIFFLETILKISCRALAKYIFCGNENFVGGTPPKAYKLLIVENYYG